MIRSLVRFLIAALLIAAVCPFAALAQSNQPNQPDEAERQATLQLTRSSGAHFFWNEDNRITGLALVGERNPDASMRLAARLPLLKALTVTAVRDRQFTDDGLASLKTMTALEGLYLSGTDFTDAGLEHIASLEGLQALRLNGELTDEGLSHLQGLTSLRLLDLYGARISGAGLTKLANLAALRTLNLDHTDVDDAGLAHMAGLTALENLHLRNTKLTDKGLQALDGLEALRTLTLDGAPITVAGLSVLAPFSCYTGFQCDNPPPADRPHLIGKGQLETLSLRDCPDIGENGLLPLANLMGLTHVQLASLDLHGSALAENKGAMQKLEQASGEVAYWRLIGAFVEFHESESWSVRTLSFTRPEQNPLFSDLGNPADAERLANLQELSLQGSFNTSASSLAPLRGLSSLEILDLRNTSLDAQALTHLEGLVRLKVLDLRGTPLTQEEVAAFEVNLKANQDTAGLPQTTCILVAPSAQTSAPVYN